MAKRTTVEVDPLILKALQILAKRYRLKIKTVSDGCFRYSIPKAKTIFGKNNKMKNGAR